MSDVVREPKMSSTEDALSKLILVRDFVLVIGIVLFSIAFIIIPLLKLGNEPQGNNIKNAVNNFCKAKGFESGWGAHTNPVDLSDNTYHTIYCEGKTKEECNSLGACRTILTSEQSFTANEFYNYQGDNNE